MDLRPALLSLVAGCSTVAAESGESTDSDGETSADDRTLGERLHDADFDADLLDWEWVREDPEAWRIEGDRLELRSDPGTLWEDANDAVNLALRPMDDGPFAAELDVRGHVVDGGEQGGLLWYVDDDNYVKFVREMVGATRSVVLVREDAGVVIIEAVAVTDADDVRLRLEASAMELVGSYRLPTQSQWTEVGRTSAALDGVPALGLFSHGGGGQRWTSFGPLSVSP